MKKLLFIVLLASMAGCGRIDRIITNWTGELTYKCADSGVEYVEYVQSDSGIAAHVYPDGSYVTCRRK